MPLSIEDRVNALKGIVVHDAPQPAHEAPQTPVKGLQPIERSQPLMRPAPRSTEAPPFRSSETLRADVLNSTLFAQLASNKKYDRQTDTTNWYDYYKYVLETVGWAVESFDLAAISDANSHGSVDNLLLELAKAYLTGDEFALFQDTIDGLKKSENDAAQKLFDSSSKSDNKANFQLGIAANAQGNAQFKIGVYTYSATQTIDKVLFFNFGTQSVSFYTGNQTMLLDTDVYGQVREQIIEKLGQNAVTLVADIDI